MMWDHTHCGEKGMQYFCCPSNIDTPTCTWRGHKNSGRCKPGCNSGEVEVGSLRMGCKTGHQTACCTSVTAVEAYGQCKWVGKDPLCSIADPRSRDRSSHADCPESHPHFIFAASAGFGGETMCDTGDCSRTTRFDSVLTIFKVQKAFVAKQRSAHSPIASGMRRRRAYVVMASARRRVHPVRLSSVCREIVVPVEKWRIVARGHHRRHRHLHRLLRLPRQRLHLPLRSDRNCGTFRCVCNCG